jgi:hypothetical protein
LGIPVADRVNLAMREGSNNAVDEAEKLDGAAPAIEGVRGITRSTSRSLAWRMLLALMATEVWPFGSARTRRRALPWESSLCLPSIRLMASFWSSWTGFRYLDPLWWMQRVLAAPARYPRATGHIIPGYPDGANYPGHLHRCRARLGGSIKSVRPDELSQPDVRTCCSVRVRRHYIRHLQDEPTWKFFYRNTFDRD